MADEADQSHRQEVAAPPRVPNRHAVIIASIRRPETLRETLVSVANQVPLPDEVIVAVHADGDVPATIPATLNARVIRARLGLTLQRNDGIAALGEAIEFVTFLDDDVELEPTYLRHARELLISQPDVVIVNGTLLANGDVDRPAAQRLIADDARQGFGNAINPAESAYGCNFTVRRADCDRERFDERLGGYAWLEDADFSLRCARHGRIVQQEGARAVHLMVPSGRPNAVKFGFSQIMNPYYLGRKGVFSRRRVVFTLWLPAVRNSLVKWAMRDKSVDRAGRLKGYAIAFRLILSGRCEPEYVKQL